jgi:predicted O-linked N-acetylglucosamine transferase (SPINDLY family)
VVEGEPRDAGSLCRLGQQALQLNQVSRAVDLLEKAVRIGATPDILVSLGIGYRRLGRAVEAEQCVRKALELDPRNADAHNNLGNVLRDSKRLEEAEHCHRRAAELRPRFLPAMQNLGNVLNDREKFAEAETVLRAALALAPRDAMTLNLLGISQQRLGRLDAAEKCYREALATDPKFASALSNLGSVLGERGRLVEAERAIRAALALAPEAATTLSLLGMALQRLGRLDAAERAYREALARDPKFASALSGLGSLLAERGRPLEAEQTIRLALALKPDDADAYNNLGNLLRDQRRFDEAVASHRRALSLRPHSANIYNCLGNDLKDMGRPNEALQCYREAVAIAPEFAEYHTNLGNALMELARLDEAVASYVKALQLKPELDITHSNLIFTLDLVDGGKLADQQAERRRWYQQHGAKFATQIRPHRNDPDPERKLRIGYVSADFKRHSAYHAFAPIIVHHDAAAFEVYCYSAVRREDAATARLKAAAEAWRSTVGESDDAVADQIRADGIDILVDLSGHSGGNRLLVFARKPAPIQVTAWGHATGTGIDTIDYFFTDAIAVLEQDRALFAEEVVNLPCAFFYEPPDYLPQLTPLPAQHGQPLSYGCVNRLEKVTDRVIGLWGRILQAATDARLVVKDKNLGDAALRERLLDRLQRIGGIARERVLLAGPSMHAEHLRFFSQIDIGLDPFPQGGGISTAEALWMGVPVVTLMGRTPPSRYTPSMLTQLGMTDWIAASDEDYVRIALEAGRDLPRLAKLRQELRERLRRSICGDPIAYTHAVEETYRSLWRRWCTQRA